MKFFLNKFSEKATKVREYHLKALERKLKKFINSIGARYYCPVCGERVNTFQPLPEWISDNLEKHGYAYTTAQTETCNTRNYRCPFCEASDRERLYALYIQEFLSGPKADHVNAILDIGPSTRLSRFIRGRIGTLEHDISYRTADLHNEEADDQVDIMTMDMYANEQFDFLVCSHVLEHVTDDRQALRELYRVLKAGGRGIIMVPIVLGLEEIDEDPTLVDESERWRRFGQYDHVRIYSKDGFVKRVKEAGFLVHQYGIEFFGEDAFRKTAITDQSVLYVVEK